jgi:ribosomal protein S18 acetylase RimI-like enzyme
MNEARAPGTIAYEWRGDFTNEEVNALHAEGFGHPVLGHDWRSQLSTHSLGWVCARQDGGLVGFVNVAWDGDTHAFILDTLVASASRRGGIGKRLVGIAAERARAAGCEWLHVDFDDEHAAFYIAACGFRSAAAGLIAL